MNEISVTKETKKRKANKTQKGEELGLTAFRMITFTFDN